MATASAAAMNRIAQISFLVIVAALSVLMQLHTISPVGDSTH